MTAAPVVPSPEPQRALEAGDEEMLRSARLPYQGDEVLTFFRTRIAKITDPEQIQPWIAKLADEDRAVRGQAVGRLISIGPGAIPLLRKAVNAGEKAGAEEANQCLDLLDGPGAADLVVSAVRAVDVARPAGTAEVLLEYLPLADDEGVVEQVQAVLNAPGDDPGFRAALLAALKDEVPLRRTAAARALVEGGGESSLFEVRPLLEDSSADVRVGVALALARHYHGEAIPVLIQSLAHLPEDSWEEVDGYLQELAGQWAVRGPEGTDPVSRRLRREVWQAWWQGISNDDLLAEVHARTLSDEEYVTLEKEVARLADRDATVSDAAAHALLLKPHGAIPLLQRARQSDDKVLALAAEKCLQAIEENAPSPVPSTVLKLLALRRPEGAVPALLAYAPFATGETEREQLGEVLRRLAIADGELSAELIKALRDPLGARRSLAAVVLCRRGSLPHLGEVRTLLKDPDPAVRFEVAQALIQRGEKNAVPALIDLLPDLPMDRAWEAEDILTTLAGSGGPAVEGLQDQAKKEQARQAWTAWWNENHNRVDLTRVVGGPRALGHLLVVESYNPAIRAGRVAEFDRKGKMLWEITGLRYPMYAEVVSQGRVLIAEQSNNQVMERDLKGKVISTHAVPSPFYCQRLRNGNTFIATRNQLLMLDSKQKPVFTRPINGQTVLGAACLRNGQIAYVTYQGNYVRLDASGKELKTFHLPTIPQMGVSGAEVLPGDRVLVSSSQQGTVVEYDEHGKERWRVSIPAPGNPHREPDGNTLVVGMSSTRVYEVNRAGKIVSEEKDLPYRPWRVSRR
jgi:HEAT repeat protein